MPKCGYIGSYGQNQALQAHVWAENGPQTAETRPDSDQRDPNKNLSSRSGAARRGGQEPLSLESPVGVWELLGGWNELILLGGVIRMI
jgi:hypothetical protein